LALSQFNQSPFDKLGLLSLSQHCPSHQQQVATWGQTLAGKERDLWEYGKQGVKPNAGRLQKEKKRLAKNVNGPIMTSKKALLTFHPQT
jgi:hypothetical protein